MTDKEKYKALLQRYWEAETTPAEERDLARYAAQADDPEFEDLRGVLGYLSIGKEIRKRQGHARRQAVLAFAAAAFAVLVSVGIVAQIEHGNAARDYCIQYEYGAQSNDSEKIMASVDAMLTEFFAGDTPAEKNLKEMFQP